MDHCFGIHHLHGRNIDPTGLLGYKGGLGEAWSHVCPRWLAGSRVGAGCGQKPHRAQVSSLGQKGQEERRATEKGEGWRKDGDLRRRASERRIVHRPRGLSAQPELPHSAISHGLGAGHGLPWFSEVAGILTQEASAQARPPQRQHPEPHLSPHPAWTLPQVPEGWGGREIPVGSKLGRWRRQREKISNFPHVPGRSQTFPGCPWFRNLTSLGTLLGEDVGF